MALRQRFTQVGTPDTMFRARGMKEMIRVQGGWG